MLVFSPSVGQYGKEYSLFSCIKRQEPTIMKTNERKAPEFIAGYATEGSDELRDFVQAALETEKDDDHEDEAIKRNIINRRGILRQ
jgi:hypothetical protein